MNENKRRISKCECCPFYAKNFDTNKWECSKKIKEYEKGGEAIVIKECVFTHHNYYRVEDDFTIQNQIIDRWLKANEQIR